MTSYAAGNVQCAVCGEQMSFLQYAEHQHPEPAPELLAALRSSQSVDPESYSSTAVVRSASSDELLQAYREARRVWSSCGGHKLAARMRNVMDLTATELSDRDIPMGE